MKWNLCSQINHSCTVGGCCLIWDNYLNHIYSVTLPRSNNHTVIGNLMSCQWLSNQYLFNFHIKVFIATINFIVVFWNFGQSLLRHLGELCFSKVTLHCETKSFWMHLRFHSFIFILARENLWSSLRLYEKVTFT